MKVLMKGCKVFLAVAILATMAGCAAMEGVSKTGGIPGYELFSDQCHFKDSTFLGELFRKEIRAAITAGNRAGPGTAGNR